MTAIETVPCGTCGEPTTYTGTKQCNDCHEVETRLRGYLKRGKRKSRAFVLEVLTEFLEINWCEWCDVEIPDGPGTPGPAHIDFEGCTICDPCFQTAEASERQTR